MHAVSLELVKSLSANVSEVTKFGVILNKCVIKKWRGGARKEGEEQDARVESIKINLPNVPLPVITLCHHSVPFSFPLFSSCVVILPHIISLSN